MQPLIIPCAPALMPGILPRGAAPCSAQPLIGRHETQVDDTISDAGGEVGAAAGPANPPRPRRSIATAWPAPSESIDPRLRALYPDTSP